MVSMVLQDRDYTKYLNEEEKKTFELEEKTQNRKGIKNNREFPRFSHPDENGFFSVILYHLKTDYKTIQTAEGLEKFQTKEGEGTITGVKKGDGERYVAYLMYNDSSYMVCIDGSNMPKKEVQKIVEGAVLHPVEKKKDIQASYIEWTRERQQDSSILFREPDLYSR